MDGCDGYDVDYADPGEENAANSPAKTPMYPCMVATTKPARLIATCTYVVYTHPPTFRCMVERWHFIRQIDHNLVTSLTGPAVTAVACALYTTLCCGTTRLCSAIEVDIHLYNYSLEIFKRQTAESLGTVWVE